MEEQLVGQIDMAYAKNGVVVNRKNSYSTFNDYLKANAVNAYFIREVVDEKGNNYFPSLIRQHIEAIEKALNAAYGDDWSYLFVRKSANEVASYFYILLHFDDIIITNSKKNKHRIKDLYVRFKVKEISGKLLISGIDGIRTTFTIPELKVGYSHSHLSSRTIMSKEKDQSDNEYLMKLARLQCIYNSFCLGQASKGSVNWILDKLGTGFNITYFHMFLIQIKSYVRWESISGVPYIRMERIRSNEFLPLDIVDYEYDDIVHNKLKRVISKPKLKLINFINGSILAKYDDKFASRFNITVSEIINKIVQFDGENFIVDTTTTYFDAFALTVILANSSNINSSAIGYADDSLNYYKHNNNDEVTIDKDIVFNSKIVNFKGSYVPIRIVKNTDKVEVYPSVFPIVKHQIANMLKSALTLNATFRLKVNRKLFIDKK